MILNSPVKVDSEEQMAKFGAALAKHLKPGDVVYLCGGLGVGKTTLARSVIRALGFKGRVKSPSYGLIESYPGVAVEVVHLDLYRLGDPREVLDLGIEAYLDEPAVLLIEWPERGLGQLPEADWLIEIRDWPEPTDAMTARELVIRRPDADPENP